MLGITVGNPFFGGVLFPSVCFGLVYLWPFLERWVTGDCERHHLLQRPRDAPWRTAFALAFVTWVAVPFVAGASDRIFVTFDVPYEGQVTIMRIAWFALPLVVFVVSLHVCRRLRATGARPLRGWSGTVVRRAPGGGFERGRAGESGPP